MIDFDLKNLKCVVAEGTSEPIDDMLVDALNKELRIYLKKNKYSALLNEISRQLPIYGSVLLKKIKDGAEIVPLQNLFIEQGARDAKTAGFVMIRHLMSPDELRKMADVWGKEKVQQVIDKYCVYKLTGYEDEKELNIGETSNYAEVWEIFQAVPDTYFGGKDENDYYDSHWVVAGVNDYAVNENGVILGENGIELFKSKITNRPFVEFHYSRAENRWLGIGVVEDTFEAQRRRNQYESWRGKALEISSMILWQTRDELVQKNVSTDIETGEIIKVSSEINRIANEERNMPAMNAAVSNNENEADRLTFSYDVIRGEASPATATATAIQNQLSQASSIFDYKRENVELSLNELVHEFFFPDLEKKIKSQHILMYTGSGEEVNKMRELVLDKYFRLKLFEMAVQTGTLPTQEEYEAKRDEIIRMLQRRDGNEIWLDIVDNFFGNIYQYVDVIIGGENRDIATQYQNLQNIFTIIARFPDAINNPVVRSIIFQLMRIVGINPMQIEMAEQERVEQQAQVNQNANQQGAEATTPQPNTISGMENV